MPVARRAASRHFLERTLIAPGEKQQQLFERDYTRRPLATGDFRSGAYMRHELPVFLEVARVCVWMGFGGYIYVRKVRKVKGKGGI